MCENKCTSARRSTCHVFCATAPTQHIPPLLQPRLSLTDCLYLLVSLSHSLSLFSAEERADVC